MTAPFWTVVQTLVSREPLAQINLERAGFEVYLPRARMRDRRRNLRIVPLFPNYLFVHVVERWSPITSTIGVMRMLRNGDAPARLSDRVVHELRTREVNGYVKLPTLRPGQRVEIVRGSFQGRIAVYEGMSGRDRERVLLELLGRKVRVVIHPCDFVPIHRVA